MKSIGHEIIKLIHLSKNSHVFNLPLMHLHLYISEALVAMAIPASY
jgi:hypothetical protein